MRILFLVDALNLYYSVRNASTKPRALLWLDLRKLCVHIGSKLHPNSTEHKVHYFTAIPEHFQSKDAKKLERHLNFISALKKTGVEVSKQGFTQDPGNTYAKVNGVEELSWVEKGTDVALTSKLFEEAFRNSFDHAVIMSNDADYLPALESFKRMYPDKTVSFAITPASGRGNRKLRRVPNSCEVKPEDYANYQLVESIRISNTKTIVRPDYWR